MKNTYTLLHIEDNPGDAFLIEKALRDTKLEFHITLVTSLNDGIGHLTTHTPDIVLLDLCLPDSDGLSGVKSLLAINPSICVIVLTGNNNFSMATAAMSLGAQDYINKAEIHPTLIMKTIIYAYERVSMTEKLKKREAQLRQIYNTVSSLIFKLAVESPNSYRFVFINQAFAKSVGMEETDIIGKRLEEIVPESNIDLVLSNYQKAIESKSRYKWEETGIFNNELKTGIVTVTPSFNEEGICEYLIGSIEDITDIKTANLNLRKSESFLRVLFENSLTAILVTDDDGNYIAVNQGAEKLFGYSKEELLSMNIRDIKVSDEKAFNIEFNKLLDTKVQLDELRFYDKQGSPKVTLYQAMRVRKDFNVFSILDITQRSNYQEEIKRLSLIATETINGAVITDRLGKTIWVNKGFEKLTGYTLEEMTDKKPGEILQGEGTDPKVVRLMSQSVAAGEPFDTEVYNYAKDGTPYIVRIQCQPIQDDSGALEGFFSIQTDITKQKAYEKKLKENERRLNLAIEAGQLATIDWDFTTGATVVNNYYYKIIEYEKETANAGLTSFKSTLLHPDDADHFDFLQQKIIKGELSTINERYRIITKTGKTKILEMNGNVLHNDKKEPKCFVGIISDITRKLKTEEAIMKAMLEAQDMEKERISREIHDGLQQTLTISVVNLHALRVVAEELPEKYQKMYHTAIRYINQGISESRTLAHSLIPIELSSYGYVSCINDIITHINGKIKFAFFENLKGKRLKKDVELSLFRITQEAINNVLKHSKATKVSLQLIVDSRKTTLTIEDDGIGFDMSLLNEDRADFGFTSMKNRALSLGGVFEVHSSKDNGTFIFVEIPGNSCID